MEKKKKKHVLSSKSLWYQSQVPTLKPRLSPRVFGLLPRLSLVFFSQPNIMSEISSFSVCNHNLPPITPPTEHHPLKITNIKLNGVNFLRWSLSVQMNIRDRGKLGYLNGEKIKPAETDAQYAFWDAENSMVMSWLVNSMEEEIAANYLGYSTAKEMWESLRRMYSDLNNQSQIYELQLKINEAK